MVDTLPPHPAKANDAEPIAVNFHAMHYARQLFGEGEQGWQPTPDGLYRIRAIYPPIGRVFTQKDFEGFEAVLEHECGILQCHDHRYSRDYITFTLTEDEFARLTALGLGGNNAGKLTIPHNTQLERATPVNAAEDVLRARLHHALFARGQKWEPANDYTMHYMELRVPLLSVEQAQKPYGWDVVRETAIALFEKHTGLRSLLPKQSDDEIIFRVPKADFDILMKQIACGDRASVPSNNVVQLGAHIKPQGKAQELNF